MKIQFRKDKSDSIGLWVILPSIAIMLDTKELDIAFVWLDFGLYFMFNI